jgi:small subunit ribosomal protein S8
MVTDPISDMLARIKNAGLAGQASVKIPFSREKEVIAGLLAKEGYLKYKEKKGKNAKKSLEVGILYQGRKPRISDVKRVSKPSRRVYEGYRNLKPVKFGHGTLILSTPKGVMTYKEALKAKVGGEALFKIW